MECQTYLLALFFLMIIAKGLKSIGIAKQHHYLKVVGLFKRTWFNSAKTEQVLNLDLGKRKIAVIGAGTYGSYTSDLLASVYPHEDITLY